MNRFQFKPAAMTAATMAIGFWLTLGCSSSIKKVDYPETADAQAEITQMHQDMVTDQQNHVDVLSPKHFKDAQAHFSKAKEHHGRNDKRESTMNELGKARAYLNQAEEVARRGSEELPQVLEARKSALTARAPEVQKKELAKVDDDLIKIGERFEKNQFAVDQNKKADLQKSYMDVELASIKAVELGPTRDLIQQARGMKASRLAPKSLETTEAYLRQAELTIEADRHDANAVGAARKKAQDEAQRLVEITRTVQNTKGQSDESVAAALVQRQQTIQNLGTEITQTEKEKTDQAQQMQQQNDQLRQTAAESAGEAESLRRKEAFNRSLDEASKKFSPQEAEVYRQGDSLLIRMKSVNFPSGRAELPGAAFSVLSKAKEVIKELNAEKITVEGHTDSMGAAPLNQKLSEQRAEAVAKYLADGSGLNEAKIESHGYGYEKPLTTNKTESGRSTNRRVDIIITPKETTAGADGTTQQ